MRILASLFVPFAAGLALAQTPAVNCAGGASCGTTPVTPGQLISIFGSNLSAGLATPSSVMLSTSLADVTSVTVDGTAAPIAFVSPGQVGIQVPWEASAGSTTPNPLSVILTNGTGPTTPVIIQVAQYNPGLVGMNLGSLQALATNADGTIVATTGSIQGVTTHAATAGDTITLFATGLGPVSPPPVTGSNSSDQQRATTTMPVVLIGGVSAQVSFSGLSTQLIGMYQISVTVPSGVPTGGAVPVQIQIGGLTSAAPATIALQ